MSKTVSFRCSEQLDEFLEQEAERRMTTKSTVAQMIVAEHFREQREESDEETEKEEEIEETTEPPEKPTTEEEGENVEQQEFEEMLEKHSEHWYEPDGQKNNYAVDPPEGVDDKRRYYKTAEGAAERLTEWFE
jgi:hypothetical protein